VDLPEVQKLMTNWAVLFSAKTGDWASDRDVVRDFSREVGPFTLDVSASAYNTVAPCFYTEKINGVLQDWEKDAGDNGAFWLQPEYGQLNTHPWIPRALQASAAGLRGAALLPSRTDRPWFHLLCTAARERGDVELWFSRRRLRFGGARTTAPFPSLGVIFRGRPS
jgi:DNA N-6-adenine-methyltransferase (Dam)